MGVEEHGSVAELAAEWDELAERTGAPPFLHAGWFDAWTAAFGGDDLVVLALRRRARLAGVLPVRCRRGACSPAANWHSPLYDMLVEDEDAARELAAAVVRRARRRLTLSFLTEESAEVCRAAAEAAGASTVLRTMMRSPYVAVAGPFDEYLRTLGRKWVKEVERLRRRIGELGEARFELTDDLGLLEQGFRVEASGWKAARGTSILGSARTRFFYERLATWAAERGMLRLAFLRLDGRPLAFELLLEHGGRRYDLKGGYDVEHARLGPGGVLAYRLLEDTHARGFESFEFLGADEPFKLRWTATVRRRMQLQAFGGLSGGVERRLWTGGRAAALRIRSLRR